MTIILKFQTLFLRRAVSFFLSFSMMFSSGLSYSSVVSAPPGTALPSALRLTDAFVPESLGKVEMRFTGSSDKTVVLIQDAHAVPDAQRSIQRLIDYFQRRYGIDGVALEGADASLDPHIFRSFPDKKLLRKVFTEYQNKGELAGATAAAIFNRHESLYQGIEDWSLYEEGVSLYTQAIRKEPQILEKLSVLKKVLDDEKQKHYPRELLSVDQMLEDFYKDGAHLLPVLQKLEVIQKPAPGSELALLLQEGKQENLDNSAAEMEVKRMAQKVESLLKSKGTTGNGKTRWLEFNARYQEFQTSRISSQVFALYLKELAEEHHLPIKISSRLSQAVKNQKRMQEIKGTKLLEAFDRYAESVKLGLTENEEQKKLNEQDKRRRIFERLAHLELSRRDWNEVKEFGRDAFLIDNAALIAEHLAFYQNAETRDAVFFDRVYSLMQEKEAKSVILVAGGFHTEGLMQRLKAQGISCLLLMPRIDSVPEETNYRAHMRGEVSWKDAFRIENGRINLYKAFVRGTRDKLLKQSKEESGKLLKSWRDHILLDLASKNQIEKAGQYTCFLDELTTTAQETDQERLGKKWRANIERFIDGLRELRSNRQFTRENILGLLNPSTMTAWSTTPQGFVRGGSVPDFLTGSGKFPSPVLEKNRSEVRSEKNGAWWTGREEAGHGKRIDIENLPNFGRIGRAKRVIKYLKEKNLSNLMIIGSVARILIMEHLPADGDLSEPTGEVDLVLRDQKQIGEFERELGLDRFDPVYGELVKVTEGWEFDVLGWFQKKRQKIYTAMGEQRDLFKWPGYSINSFGLTTNGEWIDPHHGIEDARNKVLRWINPDRAPLTWTNVMHFLNYYHSYHKKDGFAIDEDSILQGEEQVRMALDGNNKNKSASMRSIIDDFRYVNKIKRKTENYQRLLRRHTGGAFAFFLTLIKLQILRLSILWDVYSRLALSNFRGAAHDFRDGLWGTGFAYFLKSLGALVLNIKALMDINRYLNQSAFNLQTTRQAIYFHTLSGNKFPDQILVDLLKRWTDSRGIGEKMGNLVLHAADPKAALDHFVELGGGWMLEAAGINADELVGDLVLLREDPQQYDLKFLPRLLLGKNNEAQSREFRPEQVEIIRNKEEILEYFQVGNPKYEEMLDLMIEDQFSEFEQTGEVFPSNRRKNKAARRRAAEILENESIPFSTATNPWLFVVRSTGSDGVSKIIGKMTAVSAKDMETLFWGKYPDSKARHTLQEGETPIDEGFDNPELQLKDSDMFLLDIVVSPETRGKGVGAGLIAFVLSQLKEVGVRVFRGTTLKGSDLINQEKIAYDRVYLGKEMPGWVNGTTVSSFAIVLDPDLARRIDTQHSEVRSNRRNPFMDEYLAQRFALALAPPEARSELRNIDTPNPTELANELVNIQVGMSAFVEALRKETEEWINKIGLPTDGFVKPGVVKDRTSHWIGLLEQLQGRKLNISIKVSKRDEDLSITNLADALARSQEAIERIVIMAQNGDVGHDLTAMLKKNGLFFTVVKSLGNFNPNILSDQAALPIVSKDNPSDDSRVNPTMFEVGVADTEGVADPLVEVAESVLQVVAALLLADKIKDVNQLHAASEIEEIKAELLKQLFVGYSGDDIIRFTDHGNVVVSRSVLRRYLLAYKNEQAVSQAA